MNWACARCETLHTQNAKTCRECDHHILRPVDDAELRARTAGVDQPTALDLDDGVSRRSAPEPSYDSSPDVAVDGGIDRDRQQADDSDGGASVVSRLRRAWPF